MAFPSRRSRLRCESPPSHGKCKLANGKGLSSGRILPVTCFSASPTAAVAAVGTVELMEEVLASGRSRAVDCFSAAATVELAEEALACFPPIAGNEELIEEALASGRMRAVADFPAASTEELTEEGLASGRMRDVACFSDSFAAVEWTEEELAAGARTVELMDEAFVCSCGRENPVKKVARVEDGVGKKGRGTVVGHWKNDILRIAIGSGSGRAC